jgi:hypothetical protein
MLMLISTVVSGVLLLVLAVSYFKTVQAIREDDVNDAMARAQRMKNKRASAPLAGG